MEKQPVQDVLKVGKKTCEKDKVGAKILLDICHGHKSARQLLCRGEYIQCPTWVVSEILVLPSSAM